MARRGRSQGRLGVLAERRPLAEEQLVLRDALALALEELGHRGAEAGVGDPVHRPGLDRLVAAGELVPALRPGLDPGEPALDGEIDCLIVAQLEMEEGPVDEAAPVAAVERVGADEVERPGDRPAVLEGEQQYHTLAPALA